MAEASEDPRVGTLWEGRHRIIGLIGSGGLGSVYTARPEGSERLVALKVLRTGVVSSADAFERVRGDVEAACRLQHPHVVTVHESGRTAQGEAFFVMELCEGGSLADALQQRGALPLVEAARVFRDVADALAAVHEAGLAHGGLKPANVLFTHGVAKVADFLLARLLENAGRPDPKALESSHYASPEQREGRACDARSDVYSLGAVAYEALTGAPPQARRKAVPPPPRWIRPDIPEAASRVVLKALDPTPEARTPGARAFGEALAAALGAASPPPAVTKSPAAAPPPAPPPPPAPAAAPSGPPAAASAEDAQPTRGLLTGIPIGRAAEMERLTLSLEAALGGHGRLVTIAGEPGLGKTTLVTAFIGRVRAAHPHALVALGRCSEHFGSAEAYLPLIEAVASLAEGPARARVHAALRAHAPTWLALVGTPGTAASRKSGEPDVGPGQDRMPRELTSALLALASELPVVLVLEDLHWADTASVDFVAYAAPRMAGARVLIVGTYRAEDVAASDHPLGRALRGLGRSSVFSEVVPSFFSEADVAAQLSGELGLAAPAELVRFVCRKTEGNPLFVTNVLNHLLQTGALQRRGASVALTQSLESLETSVPQGVTGVIADKMDRLAEEERRLLQAASVLGDAFEAAVAAALLGEDEAACEERLDRLRRVHGLVERVGEVEYPTGAASTRYRFTHSLYQNVLYASVASRRLAEWHAQAGATLAVLHEGHLEPLLVPLAVHFEKGRDPARAIHFGEQAAELLAQRSPREALPLLERAVALSARLAEGARGTTRTRLLIRLGRHQAETAEIVGDPALYHRAEQAVSEALKLDPASAEARTILGLVHLERGHNRRAFLSFAAVLEVVPSHAPALDGLSYLFKNTGLWSESLRMQERAAALDARYAHSIRRLSCLIYQDRFVEAREEVAALVARRPKLAHYNYWAGITEYYAGDAAAAREWIERGYALDPEDRIGQGVLAFILAVQGEPGRARELLRSAEAGASADGTFTYWIAKVYASLGEAGSAVEWIARAEALGYWNAAWIATDRAIRLLHGFPPFQDRLQSVARRQAEFAQLVGAHGLP